MLYEDKDGKIMMTDEVDELFAWEIEDRKIHIYDEIGVIS